MSSRLIKKIFPANEAQLLDGGLNTKFSPAIIENNESPDCANVIFTNGTVGTRQGVAKFNTAAIGSFTIDGLYTRRDNTQVETMVVFANGTGWTNLVSTFATIPSAQSVFTSGTRICSDQYQNHMFIGNGGVIPYKYNGTDFTRHGVYPPTTTMTIATAPTGAVLTGAYSYKVTYVNSQLVEGDVSPVSNSLTVTGQNIRLTSIPVAPQSFGVSARRLYRTVTSGAVYKRLATLNDNTTTTYDDGILDTALGVIAPTDNGVPPKYSAIIYHQNRLFMNDPSNPNYIWYTNINEPYTVASTNFQRVGDNATDIVKGFAVDNNNLLVFCEKSVFFAYMADTDPANWRWIKSRSPFGSKSPYSFFSYNNKTGFAAVQNDKFVGVAALSGDMIDTSVTNLSVSTVGSELKSERIEPDMFNVQESYLNNASSIVYKNKAYISLTYGTSQTTNNRIYVMDFSMSNLAKHQKEAWVPYTGLSANQFTIYGGNLYYGSSTANGRIYKMESGSYNDDGAAIDSYFWTKEFSGGPGDTNFTKDFRNLNMLVDNAGNWFMNITYKVDSDKGSGNTITQNLDPGGSLWGVMIWGVNTWGGGNNQTERRKSLANARGRRIQFKFSNQNTVDQRFTVHRLNFMYNVKGFR